MYEIYLISGITILLIGLLTMIYFGYCIKRYNISENLFGLSESIATLSVGIFYIYCTYVLYKLNRPTGNFNFTLPEETFTLNVSEFNLDTKNTVTTFNPLATLFTTEKEIFHFVGDYIPDLNTENIYATEIENTESNEMILPSTTEEILNEEKHSSKIEAFLKNYQNMFKNAVKKKNYTERTSSETQHENTNNRYKREVLNNEKNHTCPTSNEIFLEHAMLVYAFVQGVTSLINTTWNSKIINGKEKNGNHKQNKNEEKNAETKRKEDLFIKVESLQENKQDENEIEESDVKKKTDKLPDKFNITSVLILFIMWAIPLATTLSLNFLMEENPVNSSAVKNQFDLPKLSESIKNPYSNKPLNIVTPNNQTEVKKVIENVYRIISNYNKADSSEKSANEPTIYDLINYFNKKIKSPETCYKYNRDVKIHSFILFLLGYFIVILYAKYQQMKIKNETKLTKKVKSNLNYCIFLYGLLWFPSVIEVFTRTYIDEEGNPNDLTAIFLTVGNLQKIFVNFINVRNVRLAFKNQNHIEPN